MAGSLLKYMGERDRGGEKLFWSRSTIDGAPYRAKEAPLLTEDEYDATVVRVADVKNGWFDTKVPAQNLQYLEIIDRCMNGWYQLIHLERFFNKSSEHYVEWAEYYCESGQQTPFSPSRTAELANGLADSTPPRQFVGHPSGA